MLMVPDLPSKWQRLSGKTSAWSLYWNIPAHCRCPCCSDRNWCHCVWRCERSHDNNMTATTSETRQSFYLYVFSCFFFFQNKKINILSSFRAVSKMHDTLCRSKIRELNASLKEADC